MKYLSIRETAMMLGISEVTLRRWEKLSKFVPKFRTIGNHRRYSLTQIKELINPDYLKKERKNILYSRVSSVGQKKDLEYQQQILKQYSIENNVTNIIEINDLGSGINFKKKGLKKLVHMIINNEVNTVYLTNKDRLLRFGTELIITIAEEFNTSIKILSEKQETFEETLSKDVLEIITVFSSRLYGKRSHSNINKLKKISN